MMIHEVRPLEGDDPVQALPAGHPLHDAHRRAVAVSHRRLADAIEGDLADSAPDIASVDEPIVGIANQTSFVSLIDPDRLLETATRQWLRADSAGMLGLTLEAAGRPDQVDHLHPGPLGHDPLPRRSIGRLVRALDEGYQMTVHAPGDGSRPIQGFLEDLERVMCVAALPTLFFTVRTGLGPVPESSAYGRILVQLLGRRNLGLVRADDRRQLTVGRGSVLFVPAGWTARHQPMDEDSMHLEISLMLPEDAAAGVASPVGGDVSDAVQSPVWPAWLPSRGVQTLHLVRRALVHERWATLKARLALPGGCFRLSTVEPLSRGGQRVETLALGGMALAIDDDMITSVATLLSADFVPTDDMPIPVLESLLAAGLLTVTPDE